MQIIRPLINHPISMAFKMMMIPHIIAVVVLLASGVGEGVIGMNWGRNTAQKLVPSQVVDLLLQNGIRYARIYSADEDILEAFSGSGIILTVTVANASQFTTKDDARFWVQTKSTYFDRCNITAVYLGGYVFVEGLTSIPYRQSVINSLINLQRALNEAGHGDIKATFLHYAGVLRNRTKPSESDFVWGIHYDMNSTLEFLKENNAPFVIEMIPMGETAWTNFDPNFAFPDNKSPAVVTDVNGAVYRNIFEFTYDSFVWALKKHNASDLKIIVGQTGWPTDGSDGANATAAERYFKHLLPFVASNKGTPMRPGAPIDTYVHALTDENLMPFTFSRHWGIYRSNGEPKYKIDLSGQGRDIYPTKIRGIMHMPKRWCVYNTDLSDMNKVTKEYNFACAKADCTSITLGGSCGKLTFEQNVSYAFNMYFQFQFQDEKACDFGGLGKLTVEDPSTEECVFPVEVVKGQQREYVKGKGFHERPNSAAMFAFLVISILGTLIWGLN